MNVLKQRWFVLGAQLLATERAPFLRTDRHHNAQYQNTVHIGAHPGDPPLAHPGGKLRTHRAARENWRSFATLSFCTSLTLSALPVANLWE